MEPANVPQPAGLALVPSRTSPQMQAEANMHINPKEESQGFRNDDDDMEQVIIVQTPPQPQPKQISPSLTSSPTIPQLPAQRISPPTELPFMTRPSPPRGSPIILPERESTTFVRQFTPQMLPQSISALPSPGPFTPLPPIALPLRPATPNTFRASFGNQGGCFGSPGSMGSADGVWGSSTMSPGNAKRKRSGGPTVLIPRMHPYQIATSEEIPDTIFASQPSSLSEKTDEDEPENPGKKRKIKGIMKKKKTEVAPIVLPSPGVERAELLFDMDRLSIENEGENTRGHASKEGKLGEEAGIDTGPDDNFENVSMQGDGVEMDSTNTGNTTIPEGHEENYEDYAMEETNPRTIKPLPSRRRLRSPPPPSSAMDEDNEDEEDEDKPHCASQDSDDNNDQISPPLPSTSMIPGDEEDDEEDLKTGTKGAFYYKPTPAQRWARSQKRLQQIREYKARESKEEREKRRRRRGSTPGGRIGAQGIGGGGKVAMPRKVRFSA